MDDSIGTRANSTSIISSDSLTYAEDFPSWARGTFLTDYSVAGQWERT